jgi:pyruvate formate lyase activating enzyme
VRASGAKGDGPTGLVMAIQRMSTEDGPGIRTTVFLKGCPLRCDWCQNPEGLSPCPEVWWTGSRCIGCRTCLSICPRGTLWLDDRGISVRRETCQGCGECAESCPSTALEILGRRWSAEDLIREAIKDQVFFERSGGGVTASGGEPTMQPGFAAAFLEGCRGKGLHTALDTCGQCSQEALERILPHVDLLLFDLKEMDAERHESLTGTSNRRILETLRHVGLRMRAGQAPRELWIRTPIIPGATAGKENLSAIGRFLSHELRGLVSRWDLCAFNNLCRDKYTRLGMVWALENEALMSEEDMERLAEAARNSGVSAGIVKWSGLTRFEKTDSPPEPSVTNDSPLAGKGQG